uniref:Candidate secreted effector n=1 Tax=Meloidogyne incognita TaxID=6306 RepID=A0A914NWB9_MELIC
MFIGKRREFCDTRLQGVYPYWQEKRVLRHAPAGSLSLLAREESFATRASQGVYLYWQEKRVLRDAARRESIFIGKRRESCETRLAGSLSLLAREESLATRASQGVYLYWQEKRVLRHAARRESIFIGKRREFCDTRLAGSLSLLAREESLARRGSQGVYLYWQEKRVLRHAPRRESIFIGKRRESCDTRLAGSLSLLAREESLATRASQRVKI